MNDMIKPIALLGEYSPTFPPHIATDVAIEHSRNFLGVNLSAKWVSTADIDPMLFEHYSGLWVAPGSPYKDMELTLWAIRYARENNIPCFGTCGGFQHMVIEYARNVLGFKDAQHAEYDPYTLSLFISQLAYSLSGREMQLSFEPGSLIAAIYGRLSAIEHYYCNFGVNPDCIDTLKRGPLHISGSDAEGEIRVIEHPDHPFFIGTLFVPQAKTFPVLFVLLSYWQSLLALLSPMALFRLLFANVAGDDKALAADLEFQSGINKVLKSCFIGRVQGYVRDVQSYVRPWKTALSEITVNTHIWHGAEDNWSPVAMAEYLQSATPGCTSTQIFKGLSHYSCLYQVAPEICRQLGSAS